jgi:hypothetical protein
LVAEDRSSEDSSDDDDEGSGTLAGLASIKEDIMSKKQKQALYMYLQAVAVDENFN